MRLLTGGPQSDSTFDRHFWQAQEPNEVCLQYSQALSGLNRKIIYQNASLGEISGELQKEEEDGFSNVLMVDTKGATEGLGFTVWGFERGSSEGEADLFHPD